MKHVIKSDRSRWKGLSQGDWLVLDVLFNISSRHIRQALSKRVVAGVKD